MIDDGATLQLGIGSVPDAVLASAQPPGTQRVVGDVQRWGSPRWNAPVLI